MDKPRFGLDLDGVVYDFEGAARFILRSVHGIDIDESPYWDHIPQQLEAVGRKELWDWLYSPEGGRAGLWRSGHVLKGAVEAARELAALTRLVVITRRPRTAVPDTLLWLGFHGIPADEVHVLGDMPKHEVEWCQWYVDDNADNAADLERYTLAKRVFLWDQPWNADVSCRGRAKRVSDWNTIIEEVKRG